MAKLTRNYSDPESRKWWEEAEKAAANAPKIFVPSQGPDTKVEVQAEATPGSAGCDDKEGRGSMA